jgi:DNA-binding response OmpR family regulator
MLVCLIDDDAEDVELFAEALKDVNPEIECVEFHKLPHALKHLQEDGRVPSVIFLDAHLPSGSSMEFLKEMRTLKKLDAVRIFIYSGFVSDSERTEYRKLGATDVITKPHHFNDLRALLGRLMM